MKIKTKRGARRIRNQRVITRRFVTTDYTGCSYITAGKRYEVDHYSTDKNFLRLIMNGGIGVTTMRLNSTHLDGHDWRWCAI